MATIDLGCRFCSGDGNGKHHADCPVVIGPFDLPAGLAHSLYSEWDRDENRRRKAARRRAALAMIEEAIAEARGLPAA